MHSKRLQRIYFETSAVNAFKDRMPWQTALNTKAYQNLRGRGYFISPVVIFEILTTKNATKREELIFFAQHLFEDTLLPSPEELIVNFLDGGCKRSEPEYHLISKGQTAEHWRRICEDRRKTLLYDEKGVQAQSSHCRELGKLLFDFHNHQEVQIPKSDAITGANITIFGLVETYQLATKAELIDPDTRQHIGLITFLIVLILCAGITLDRMPIEEFWAKKGISQMDKRVHYIFSKHPELVSYGPFQLLAAIIRVHTDRTFSRGMIFDCFHALYSVYADVFLTADAHFIQMRENFGRDTPIHHKIFHLDEIEINFVETSEPTDPKGWLEP